MNMAEDEEETPLLLPCSICNRTFIPSSLEKHRKICEKTTSKKRGVFNSFKQRLQGTGLEEFLPLSQININSTLNISESKWRQKHLEFVNTVRKARGIQDGCTESKKCTPSSRRRISSTSNETCPYCQRSFGIKAFDRHLEWCKEQKARIPKTTPSSQAKERLEARTKYRAPLGSKSKRTTTKEKYSSITNIAKPKSPAAYGSNIVKSPLISTVKEDDKKKQGLKPVRNKDVQHSPVIGNRRAQTATICRTSTPSRIKSSTGDQFSPVVLGNSPVVSKQKKGTTSKRERSFSTTERIGGLAINALNRNNRRNDSSTNRERPEVYDPFVSAERQMQELMGPEEQWHSPQEAEVQNQKDQQCSTMYLPTSNDLCTSPVSAFAKYSFFNSDDEIESYLERLQDETENNELSYPKSEEMGSTAMLQKISLALLSSTPEQQTMKGEPTSELDSFQHLHPMSLDNLDSDFEKQRIIMIENDTCSEGDTLDGSFGFDSFQFDMENLENEIERIVGKRKKNTKYRAKLESAALALQQSVSLYHPGPITKPSDEVFPSSESETESSSHLFQKTSFIHSLQDLNSTNSEEKISIVSEPVTSENENYVDAVKADSDTGNVMCCIVDNQVNMAYAAGNKISGDSAYSSLNRKSPPAEITQQVFEIFPELPMELPELNMDKCELPVLASTEPRHEPEDPGTLMPSQPISSSEFNNSSKLSNFCHNCGLRYPVACAKFCCECGIKRLCM